MTKSQHSGQIFHQFILEMTSMIRCDFFWDSKLRNDVIEHEICRNFTIVASGQYGFGPLSEVVHGHDDISMAFCRHWVACHKVYHPFSEWTDSDNWM